MAQETVVHVSDRDFEDVILKADKPALVDFWAPWCGPCKALGPAIEALADQYKERVIVSKLNVDDNPLTAAKFGIRSIPTVILFKDGKAVDTLLGLVPKEKLETFLQKVL
ncbi:MAG: thioredoxin [Syntrophales bacterium]|nr:thioredoxin [Syntrophales bacterium]